MNIESAVRSVRRRLGLKNNSLTARISRPMYELTLALFYGRRGLPRVINGDEIIFLRPDQRKIDEVHEPSVYYYLKGNNRPGGTFLDVGANVGIYSIIMARWMGLSGRVFAFEPVPASYGALRDHIYLNNVNDRVTIVPLAVSDSKGKTRFIASATDGQNSIELSRAEAGKHIVVEMTTIDDFCEKQHIAPNIIKIDIEGFEFHALRGAEHTLKRYRPLLIVEMHPWVWPSIGESPAKAIALLDRLHYEAIPLEGQKDVFEELGHAVLVPKPE